MLALNPPVASCQKIGKLKIGIYRNLSSIGIDHLRNRVCTVVDLGCANGAWLMDMATQFPDCSFVGIEFSAQSTLVPQMLTLPNVRTETTFGQLDQPLSLESSSVDLCHMRAQGLEFDQRDWMHLLSEAYRVLKPGGLLQIVDGHFAMKGTVLIESFFDTVRTLMQEQNREFDIALKYEQLLEQSGFQLLEKKCKTVQYAADESSSEDFTVVSLRALENAQELLAERMGLDDEEYQQRVEMVCAQCVQRGSGLDWYVYVARKPWTR
ncbi:S-adenosyl-L-methionine-dependent methyltransferase [Lichtheimia hyalospora FSU 10163]|nr:S-adenosyl-L-methionine-dependent methyltransferase [Lichtheimia hyalospora FSU 10163]